MHDDKLEGSALIRQVVRDNLNDAIAGIWARSGWDSDRSRQFLAANVDEFERQATLAEVSGDLLEAEARALELRILRRASAELDSLDLMEAAPLLRYTGRVLERAERVRAAERDKGSKLPVLHITIFGSEPGSPPILDTSAGVIDAETVEVKPVADAEPPRLTASEPQPLAFLDALKGATPVIRDEGDRA